MIELINPNLRQKMIVKTVTWQKDSHELFDYELTKNIITEQFTISLQRSFIFFYRNNSKSETMFIKKLEMIPNKIEGVQLLGCYEIVPMQNKKFRMNFHNSSQFNYQSNKLGRLGTQVSNSSGEYKQENIYFIVRSLKNDEQEPKGFVLKTGQKIKFGRVQFKVIVMKKNDRHLQCPKFFEYDETLQMQDKTYGQEEACKICLSNEQTEPLSFFCTPCDCVGSCSIVHFDCLFQWCKTKVKKSKISKVIHYNFQKFECQICKKYFPRFISRKNVKYDLLPIDKPEDSYMVLISTSNQTQKQKSLIMISYAEDSVLKIGRNQTCDIRSDDISVSRQHASIETRNGEFLLYDNRSKFGTIVSQPNFHLDLEKVKRGIQVGRTVVTFQLYDKEVHGEKN